MDENNKRTRKTKDWAYSQLCKKARKLLLEGKMPVLDATFHKHYRRKWVYELARKLNAEVYLVWIIFGRSVKSVARERSREKKALHTEDQYLTMVSQTDELEGSELKLKIIKFERSAGKVRLYNCEKDEFAKRLAEAVYARSWAFQPYCVAGNKPRWMERNLK